ncbi:hypothetical protein PMAYCL1PPCAC_00949, partial [Pristionchus mayeri]
TPTRASTSSPDGAPTRRVARAPVSSSKRLKMMVREKKNAKDDLVKTKLRKTTQFDKNKLVDEKYEGDGGMVHKMKPEELTEELYYKDGLKNVYLFDDPPTGMKVPPRDFTPLNVMQIIGGKREFVFHDSKTQKSFTTGFTDFVKYLRTPRNDRNGINNAISTEVSGTGMIDMVQAPALVRQIDFATNWPDAQKQRRVKFGEDDALFSSRTSI